MNDNAGGDNRIPLKFTGTARQYFGIWIVNILLTALTLGIYSAWAKVRTKRYFYGNTLLDETPFDFLARPITILKGWLIAAGVFLVYVVVTNLYPATSPLFSIGFLILLPWIIIRSMAFRLRNTSFRNIRFNFGRNYREAVGTFIGMPVLTALSLGLAAPYMVYRQKRFFLNNASFGQDAFVLPAMGRKFYEIYLVVVMGVSATIAVAGLSLSAVAGGVAVAAAPGTGGTPVPWSFVIIFAVVALTPIVAFPYLQAAINNAIWNNVEIAGHRFESTLRAGRLAWLHATNALVIALSLGLMIPWARVRMARYRVESLALRPRGDLGHFIAGAGDDTNAAGDELGEAFDVDIGL